MYVGGSQKVNFYVLKKLDYVAKPAEMKSVWYSSY